MRAACVFASNRASLSSDPRPRACAAHNSADAETAPSWPPEFTHQLFDDERIEGFRRPDDFGVLSDEDEDDDARRSPPQALRVRLVVHASTLDACWLEITGEKGGDKKDLRKLKNNLAMLLPPAPTSAADAAPPSPASARVAAACARAAGGDDDPEVEKRAKLAALKAATRQVLDAKEEAAVRDDWVPPGDLSMSYEAKASGKPGETGETSTYEVYHVRSDDASWTRSKKTNANGDDDPDAETVDCGRDRAAAFHERAESFAYLLVDGASAIDARDERWDFLYLFERPPARGDGARRAFVFAGYETLFTFSNPVRGDIMRLAQCVVLPPHQRRGHGARLVARAAALARARDHVGELTVEDPAPGFVRTRDAVDVRDAKRLADARDATRGVEGLFFDATASVAPTTVGVDDDAAADDVAPPSCKPLDAAALERGRERLKLTRAQLTRVYEAHVLAAVDAADSRAAGAGGAAPAAEDVAPAPAGELRRRYRLMVKRRLHRERKTELEPLEAAERQKKLEEWFAELEGQYRKALEAADKAEKYAQLEQNGAGPV